MQKNIFIYDSLNIDIFTMHMISWAYNNYHLINSKVLQLYKRKVNTPQGSNLQK